MNKTKSLLLLAVLVFAVGQARAERSDARQENQEARIEEGVASGQLSAKEQRHLKAQQQHIKNLKHKAAADGQVTNKEKVKLEVAQDHASHAIARKKHNNR